MTEKKEYPEEIYTEKMNVFGVWTCRLPDTADVEKAYDIGLAHGKEQPAQPDPLAGFSNLTQAIQDGTRIDWEKLDKRVAKCVHPELGTLTHKMERSTICDVDSSSGWLWPYSFQRTWVEAFVHGWRGEKGWSLWVEGEIPVKTRTADELEPGTCFYGKLREATGTFFIFINSAGAKRAYSIAHSDLYEPEKVEVLEVYGIGTLQPSKEKA